MLFGLCNNKDLCVSVVVAVQLRVDGARAVIDVVQTKVLFRGVYVKSWMPVGLNIVGDKNDFN